LKKTLLARLFMAAFRGISGHDVCWQSAFIVWLLIALAEGLHGILRVRFSIAGSAARRARQISLFSGSGIILAIVWCAVPWVGAGTVVQLLGVGSF
jgi:hypothetical protein